MKAYMNGINDMADKVIKIKDEISSDLALRLSASSLYSKLEALDENEIRIDFDGVLSISRSFAHEYMTRKLKSNKKIIEINVPDNVHKMFRDVNSKSKFLDPDAMKVETI